MRLISQLDFKLFFSKDTFLGAGMGDKNRLSLTRVEALPMKMEEEIYKRNNCNIVIIVIDMSSKFNTQRSEDMTG